MSNSPAVSLASPPLPQASWKRSSASKIAISPRPSSPASSSPAIFPSASSRATRKRFSPSSPACSQNSSLGRIFTGKFPNLASAYITGISVGILVRSPAFWPYAICSIVSIMSKYVLRVKGRHIWNPSNFGISAMLFLAPETVASLSIQWGNYLLPMIVIWCLGAVIVWRVRRFHITATYVVSFFAFAFLRSWITGSPWQSEIAPITGPMYQLFIFFMVTDPKTTVRTKRGQCLVVFLVAVVEMILRLNQVIYAPFYALFLVGPAALLIEMWRDSRRSVSVPAHA